MKLSKGVISRDEAFELAPDYVKYIEDNDRKILFDKIIPAFDQLRLKQDVITFSRDAKVFVRAKITSLNSNSPAAVDGPIVRLGNGEYSWRVDGDGYSFPI